MPCSTSFSQFLVTLTCRGTQHKRTSVIMDLTLIQRCNTLKILILSYNTIMHKLVPVDDWVMVVKQFEEQQQRCAV